LASVKHDVDAELVALSRTKSDSLRPAANA